MRRRPDFSTQSSRPDPTGKIHNSLYLKRFWKVAFGGWALLGLGFTGLLPLGHTAQAEEEPVAKVFLDDVIVQEGDAEVELRLRILSPYGDPIEGIEVDDLAIRDGGRLLETTQVRMRPKEVDATPQAAIVAIDSSDVMAKETLDRIDLALRTLVEKAASGDRLAVLRFHDNVETVVPFDAPREQALASLESRETEVREGAGRLFDAAGQAVELARNSTGLPRQVFALIVSDGRDGGSERTAQEVILLARGDAEHSPVPIFTIGYAPEDQEGFANLKRLSESTGAQFFQLNSAIHLPAITSAIWKQMQSGYVLRFPVSLDGEIHEFVVSAGESSAKRRARFPYLEPQEPPSFALAIGGGLVLLGLAMFLLLRNRRKPAGRLVFKTGPLAGQIVPVRKKRTRIGAVATQNDIVIENDTASRHHAVVERKGDRVEIQDLESTNGTFVNGTRVTAHTLEAGDRIQITDVDIVYEA